MPIETVEADASRLSVSTEHYFFGIVNPPPTISMDRPRVQTRYDFDRSSHVELYFTQRSAVRSLLQSSRGQLQGYGSDLARIPLERCVGIFSPTTDVSLSIAAPDDIDHQGSLNPSIRAELRDEWTCGVVLSSGSIDLSDAVVILDEEQFGNPFLDRCGSDEPWTYHGYVPLASRATYPSFVRLATGIVITEPPFA
jgi:hypothetical protein